MFMIGESSLRVAARCSAAWVIICANEPNCQCGSPRNPDTPSSVVLSRCLTNHFGSAESFALSLTLCWRRRPSLCSFEEAQLTLIGGYFQRAPFGSGFNLTRQELGSARG